MFPFFITYLLAFSSSGLFGPLVPAALLASGFSASAIANAVAAQNTVRVIAPALWGQLADRSARPARLAALSFAAAGVCHIAIIYAPTPLALVIVYAVLGFVGGAGVPIVDGLVLSALEARNEERARFGRIRVFGTVGFALSTFAVGVLRDHGETVPLTRGFVLFPSAVFIVLAATAILTTKVQARSHDAAPARLRDLAKNPAYVLLLAFTFCQWASHATYTVFVVPLGEARGLSPLVVASAIVLGLAVEALIMRRSGDALARFGGRGTLMFVSATAIVRWIGFSVHPDNQALDGALFLFFSACHGFSFGLFYPVVVHLVTAVVAERQRHSALSVLTAISFGLGGAAGAAASGHALDHLGAQWSWLVMIPFAILAFVLANRLERGKVAA